MHPAEGRGVELRLNDTLLHGWCRMLQKACREAEWDLVLDFPGGTSAGESEVASRVLNWLRPPCLPGQDPDGYCLTAMHCL